MKTVDAALKQCPTIKTIFVAQRTKDECTKEKLDAHHFLLEEVKNKKIFIMKLLLIHDMLRLWLPKVPTVLQKSWILKITSSFCTLLEALESLKDLLTAPLDTSPMLL